MSPTSRNTLMIGGALIVIALLLTCGPWGNLLGGADGDGEPLPSVAAAPPPQGDAGALDAAIAGAAAGGQLGDSDVAGTVGGGDHGATAPLSATTVAAATGAAAAAAASTGGGAAAASTPATSALPPVSSGVPITPVAAANTPNPAALAAAAAGAFDDAFDGGGDLAGAGSAADRFPPPVAAAGSAFALVAASEPFGTGPGGVRQPCDSPGAGCQRITSDLTLTGGPGPNPPIIPGVRPTPRIANPPIIPGVRPVPAG